MGTTESEVADRKAWLRSQLTGRVADKNVDRNMALYHQMSGTPDQVIDRLRSWEQAGLQYTIPYFPDVAYDRSSLELFAREVMPALS